MSDRCMRKVVSLTLNRPSLHPMSADYLFPPPAVSNQGTSSSSRRYNDDDTTLTAPRGNFSSLLSTFDCSYV